MQSEITAKVCSIVRLRINTDGRGVRSAVFLYGCPLKCQWCCNPETWTGEGYQTISPRVLYDLIKRDIPYFQASGGGVTFSGGEPLLHLEFIREFIRISEGKFNINMETSLYGPRQAVESLLPHVDHWYVDYKADREEDHLRLTGVSAVPIRENLALLAREAGAEKITLTYPVVPGRNDSEEHVRGMIRFMQEHGLELVQLHPYRKKREQKYEKMGLAYEPVQPVDQEKLDRIRKMFTDSGIRMDVLPEYRERRKCDVLKAIRREIRDREEIPVDIPDCTFEGRCPGTCPQCESELRFINDWREKREKVAADYPKEENILCQDMKN